MKSISVQLNGGAAAVALGAIVTVDILVLTFLCKMPVEAIERISIHMIDSAKERATTVKLEA